MKDLSPALNLSRDIQQAQWRFVNVSELHSPSPKKSKKEQIQLSPNKSLPENTVETPRSSLD